MERGLKLQVVENKLFEYTDLVEVERSAHFHALRAFVDKLTCEGIACTTRGTLQSSNLNDPTTWYRHTVHYLRAWEYIRVLDILAIPSGAKVLDVGGAATPIVFYLTSEKDCAVTTVDLQNELVEHTNEVAKRMKWKLGARCMDIAEFDTDQVFDFAISISVLEHMRPQAKQIAIAKMAKHLKPGGAIGISFDFGQIERFESNFSGEVYLPIKSIEEIQEYIVQPSGCHVIGSNRFQQAPLDEPVAVKKQYRHWRFIPFFPPRLSLLRKIFYRPLGYTYGTVFLIKPK